MGLQLSVLVGCAGALELLACLRHMFVCVLNVTDHPSNCSIGYFHRSKITDDFVIVEKPNLEDDDSKQNCSEIEAILRENRSDPDILCIGPPSVVDDYVRIPTPIPFGVDDEVAGQKSSSNASSLIDSGNENPVARKSTDNLLVSVKQYHGSSSDVSSVEDTSESPNKTTSKKVLRRSRTPELRGGYQDDYDDGEEEEDASHQKKHKSTKSTSTLASRRSVRSKPKNPELGRSVENLSSTRRSKRHREPERCKSDIQIQVARNLLRDEWTNTSPVDSDVNLSRASSKRSISVLIQTSFEDKLHFPSENNRIQNLDVGSSKLNVCPNCRCRDGCEPRLRQVTETESSVDGRPQLIKISSFEEASGEDYEKVRKVLSGTSAKTDRSNDRSIESESHDEYVDAEEVGLTTYSNPIQYMIPDPGDNQAFWVIRRPRTEIRVCPVITLSITIVDALHF